MVVVFGGWIGRPASNLIIGTVNQRQSSILKYKGSKYIKVEVRQLAD
jgi:hypothetical protein